MEQCETGRLTYASKCIDRHPSPSATAGKDVLRGDVNDKGRKLKYMKEREEKMWLSG